MDDTPRTTRSLSPRTNKTVEARIVKEGGRVYLAKTDESGESYKALVEKDASLYDRLTLRRVPRQIPYDSVFLYLTPSCNLNCPVCYESHDSGKTEMSVREVRDIVSRYRGKMIVLGGREPTCHPDLFEIIRVANEKNHSRLLTNGVKLADERFVAGLKDAGLQGVIFSFNGFRDQIYEAMNGKPLFHVKTRALENLRRARIGTALSVTLARGINDDQIPRLYDFCLENRSFIGYLLFRSMMTVGRHLEVEPFVLSELFEMVTSGLGVDREHVLREIELLDEFGRVWGYDRPRLRTCGFDFHVACRNGRRFSVGKDIRPSWKRLMAHRAAAPFLLWRLYGARYLLEQTNLHRRVPFSPRDREILRVGIRIWPNIYNVDLQENWKCPTGYYKGGRCLPFCVHNVLDTNCPEGEGAGGPSQGCRLI